MFLNESVFPQGKEKMADMRRKTLSRNSKSDHLTIVNAFKVKKKKMSTPVTSEFPFISVGCVSWTCQIIMNWLARAGRKQSSVVPGMRGSSAGTTSCLQIHSRWVRLISRALHWSAFRGKENKGSPWLYFWILLSGHACFFRCHSSFYHSDAAQYEGSVCRASHARRLCQQQRPQRPQI